MNYKSCPTCGNQKSSGVYRCTKCKQVICRICGKDKSIHKCGTTGGVPLGTIVP